MSGFWMTVVLAGLALFFLVAPVLALFRARRKLAAQLAALGVIVAGYGIYKWSGARNDEARVAGFANAIEQDEAARAGVTTAADWAARQRQEAAEKAERDKVRQEIMAKVASDNDAACRKDLKCLAERVLPEASVVCDDLIERMAKYQFEWTGGFLEPVFSRYRWRDMPKGEITFIGDRIKFQNGFGAWQNMVYQCDYDAETGAILDVRVEGGRL